MGHVWIRVMKKIILEWIVSKLEAKAVKLQVHRITSVYMAEINGFWFPWGMPQHAFCLGFPLEIHSVSKAINLSSDQKCFGWKGINNLVLAMFCLTGCHWHIAVLTCQNDLGNLISGVKFCIFLDRTLCFGSTYDPLSFHMQCSRSNYHFTLHQIQLFYIFYLTIGGLMHWIGMWKVLFSWPIDFISKFKLLHYIYCCI